MSKQYTLTQQEVSEWLSDRHKKEAYKMKGHQWSVLKGAGKQYCKCCGLLALNNNITHWAIEKGCNYEDHPQWVSTLKRLTKRKW